MTNDQIIDSIDRKTLRLIEFFIKHTLIDLKKPTDGAVKFGYFSICDNADRLRIVNDNVTRMLLYYADVKYSYVSHSWNIKLKPEELERSIRSKCSYCKEEYKVCPIKALAYFVHHAKERGLNARDFVRELLGEEQKTFSGDAKEVARKVGRVDPVVLQIARIWHDLITIDGIDDNTVKYSYVEPTLKIEEYIKNVFYSNQPKKVHKEIKISDFEEEINKRYDLALPQNPIVFTAYLKYLCEIHDANFNEVISELIGHTKYQEFRNTLFYRVAQAEIMNLAYDDTVKSKLVETLNYVDNYSKGQGTFMPFNAILYTRSNKTVDEIAKILKDIFVHYKYLPGAFIDETSADEIALKYIKANEVYNTNDNKVVVIKNMELLLTLNDTDKPNVLNTLARSIRKKENIFTIISGNKKSVKPFIMQNAELYNTIFNIKLSFEEFSKEKVQDLVVDRLKSTNILTDEFTNKLSQYIDETYKESVLKSHEYIEGLCREIVFNNGKKAGAAPKLPICVLPEPTRKRNLDDILQDLNQLTGLENIKKEIDNLVAVLEFNNKIKGVISRDNLNLHMIFNGNPGTGKTMVARIVAEIFYQLGYVKQNKLIEVEAKDLIAEYVGQTSVKTSAVVQSALDGVLFIDEAYATANGSLKGTNSNFGQDFISTLIKAMEDYKDRLIIIFAGYKEEMDRFERCNPGLQSRIGYRITFDDYTNEQLRDILKQNIDKSGLKIEAAAVDAAFDVIQKAAKVQNFGNARFVVNFFQDILLKHAKNVRGFDDKDKLTLITKEDISADILKKVSEDKRYIGF